MATQCPKCKADNPDESKFCNECGLQLDSIDQMPAPPTQTIEAPREELTTGSTFAGRYQIIEEIGKGGMGKVYKVLDKEVKAKIALKLIKPEIAADKKTIERFRNELKTARDISHKNICRMYDLNKEESSYYITMEYVSGEDLKSLIRRVKQLAIGTVISIAKQVCEGLTEAHRLGVVHRDLKPSNIMIDKEGNVRIMDFGIARSLESKGITGAGVMIGTPEYMSPEQVEGKDIDQRSDIYSLGVILYEMVTGRVPFEGDTPFTIGVKHKSEIPKDPKVLNTQIPGDLSNVILKCLEKDKEKRFQSAGEVRNELINIEKDIPTTDRAVPKRKPLTSKEITVTFGLKKLFVPALVVIALAIVGVLLWQILPQKGAVPLSTEKPSIAVLPFDDLSPQKDQTYFCDGLADELINRLTNIERLRVPARTSAFSFKGKELDVQEIGKKLNVEMVLEGSLRKAGDKLRLTVQLVNVADGYPVWSEKYERDEKDVFLLQDEISLAIIDKLKVELLGEEKEKIVKHYTENLEAYNLYLQGRYFWNRRTEESLNKAIEYFEKAIEIDASYALAYAGLADAYIVLPAYSPFPAKKAYSGARKAVLKALEIDDTLAEAHTSLSALKAEADFDREGAERSLKRAIELKPNYAQAHYWYAELLSNLGRHNEALVESEKALELDPLSLIANLITGMTYYFKGQYDQAIEQCLKVIEMDPNRFHSYRYLGLTYLEKGMYEEAITEFRKAISLAPDNPMPPAWLAYAYAVSGKTDEAFRILEELKQLSEQEYVPSFWIAMIYAGLDENDIAFEWLEKAYEERCEPLNHLKVDPVFKRLHSDPRFTALLKKLGLEK